MWNLSVDFVKGIYEVTMALPKSEAFGLTSQLRRAAVSLPSNIAEGAARSSAADRRRFYQIARSSLVEIDTQPAIATRLNYLDEEHAIELAKEMNHIFAKLSRLIQSTA